jgi:hypothetical protein
MKMPIFLAFEMVNICFSNESTELNKCFVHIQTQLISLSFRSLETVNIVVFKRCFFLHHSVFALALSHSKLFKPCVLFLSEISRLWHENSYKCEHMTWISQSVQRWATGVTAKESGFDSQQGQEIFFSSQRPVRLSDPPSPLSNGYWGHFSRA